MKFLPVTPRTLISFGIIIFLGFIPVAFHFINIEKKEIRVLHSGESDGKAYEYFSQELKKLQAEGDYSLETYTKALSLSKESRPIVYELGEKMDEKSEEVASVLFLETQLRGLLENNTKLEKMRELAEHILDTYLGSELSIATIGYVSAIEDQHSEAVTFYKEQLIALDVKI
jgi:hypothetical protein